jgi:hypothetical protein
MPSWTTDELDRIGHATELDVASRRADDTLSPYVTIWGVRQRRGLRPVGHGPDKRLVSTRHDPWARPPDVGVAGVAEGTDSAKSSAKRARAPRRRSGGQELYPPAPGSCGRFRAQRRPDTAC